ncbi:MAG TPA: ABC transporter permease subunit [Anaerolineae bacterium]|nr:ABC transporter permease subunit [Caldilineae bacterium]HID35685.1 ABC transporter permease subunit [Anaerolineae bacterium]HIQ12562.1 ABC transporter permease subunit [Caldilineales bacterium]
MEIFLNGLRQALALIMSLDPSLIEIVRLSLAISGLALVISALLGLPAGLFLGLKDFPGKRMVVALVYTGMGLPPVVVGLTIYLLLSRQGPLGDLGWLFTSRAMIVTQTILALPLIIGFTMTAIAAIPSALIMQLRSLGATRRQVVLTLLYEARSGVLAALVAGFGAIISEVGSVLIVGGNIEHKTRVLTTAIVLETRKGNFSLAIALGIILLTITFSANWLLLHLQGHLDPRQQ